MGYVEQLLSKDETILQRSRQHWVALLASALTNGFIIIIALVLRILIGNVLLLAMPDLVANALTVISIAVALFGVVRFGWDVLQWSAEEYLITNRRVMQTEGIINKRTSDSSLEKVNDVILVQSFFGRILGYGNLEIVTGSDVGVNNLRRLHDPISFKTAMLDAKAALDGYGRAPASDAASDADVPKLIAELDELRKKGLISDAEFNEKKAKLLSQL